MKESKSEYVECILNVHTLTFKDDPSSTVLSLNMNLFGGVLLILQETLVIAHISLRRFINYWKK